MPALVRSPLLMLALASLVIASGCGRDKRIENILGSKYTIDEIDFWGVTRFDKDTLLGYVMMGEEPFFGEPSYYIPGAVPAESDRVVAAYHSVGYYDAEVLDVRAFINEGRREADIIFVVDEGEVTRVTSVGWVWTDADTVEPERRQRIERLNRLRVGDPFEVEKLNLTVADTLHALKESGYPYVEVTERPIVDRIERTATVRFEVSPGPRATLGQIDVTGLVDVPEKPVRNEFLFAPGKTYAPSLLERVEASVYALDVFRSVVAVPAPALDDEGRLDLTLRVDEAQPQSVQLGGGLLFEATRWEQVITARYSHRNLFGELTRLDVSGRIGYAELPTIWQPVRTGLVGDVDLGLKRRGLFERKLVWTAGTEVELDIEEGYRFWAAEPYLGVSRFFTRRFQLALTYRFRYLDFFDINVDATSDGESELIKFIDPYRLSTLEAVSTFYLTDRVLQPRNGVIFESIYVLAGGAVGGDFDYEKNTNTLKLYWTPWSRLKVLGRAQVGLILPYGKTDAYKTPTDQKLYLGGSNTIRGWGLNRLSPQLDDTCAETFIDLNAPCEGVPIGGHSSVLGNLELQIRFSDSLWIAAFTDVGDVRAFSWDFAPDEWNYTGGGGIRYASPVGSIRVDLGFRLNSPPRFRHEPGWAFHLALGDAF